MTRTLLAFAVLGLGGMVALFGAPSSAEACRCIHTDQVSIGLLQSDTVFVGRPLAAKRTGTKIVYQFRVEQSFKGPKALTRLVSTNASSAACGYAFQRGRPYVVYGVKEGPSGALVTSRCTRTRPAAGADEELRLLTAAIKVPGTLGALCGTIGATHPCARNLYCRFEMGTRCGLGGMGGTCQGRPAVCTRELKPVCACNGITYSNKCGAAAAGASVDKTGRCPNQAYEGTIP